MITTILKIALDAPLDFSFDYRWRDATVTPQAGQLARVQFGRREVTGLILGLASHSEVPENKLKDANAILQQLPPLSAHWIALCQFAADYYQRPLGEVALPGLPKNLRASTTVALDRALKKLAKLAPQTDASAQGSPSLNPEQQVAVDAIAAAAGLPVTSAQLPDTASLPATRTAQAMSPASPPASPPVPAHAPSRFQPFLLFGVTGSGKTEVYLQASARILAADPAAQILILVPEINLTPQLEANIGARFPGLMLATLHSGLAEGERTRHWLAAHSGQAHIILGTRLAILASIPHLRLIIIDEEHDPSYKQQEGLRYSARDLAVWRAHQLQIPVVLGSATPALESWQHAQTGRYHKLVLKQRAVHSAQLPAMRLIDSAHDKPRDGLSMRLISAIRQRLEAGQQSLLFLNRRGYAPVLNCESCGWISNCLRCTAFMVLHKPEHRLRCHHCSLELRIPKHCPTCGNVDLQALGRGTQRIEEGLQSLFPQARILRIDADSTRHKGSAQAAFEQVHQGEVDILIGTQMVAKGHDFKRLNLVGILNPDSALFSHDYRASERLFAQLLQVAGRAGRAAGVEGESGAEVLIQTRYPQHALYASLLKHDYEQFASHTLEERQQAALPPFIFQALLRAEAREVAIALEFLSWASAACPMPGITLHDPIPLAMTRVANMERAQLLIESPSRPALQAFLKRWLAHLRHEKAPTGSRVAWSLEVDPVDI